MLNGDPAASVHLTELGREQARALGEAVGPVDLVAHTEFARTRETAELAWPGTPTLVVPELNEITFGRFEGTPWHGGYDVWTISAGPEDECPGGGESRVVATRRYIRGYRLLLGRPEERLAFVGHGAHIRLLLLAVEGLPPAARLQGVEPATAFSLTRDEVERALELLEAWVDAPTFAADVTIRRARPGDGDGLAHIWLENARYYVGLAPDDFQLPRAQGLAEFLDPSPEGESTARVFLVAEVDGELAGYAVGTLRPPHAHADRQYVPYHAETRLYVDALGVGDAYQRRGIATRLVEELEEWGRQQGATLSATDTYVHSPLSVPFWQERMGYRPRSVVMWKRLAAGADEPDRRSQ